MIPRLRRLGTPYRLALGSAGFRRLIAGYAVSALGDGAGYVAVAWFATELVPAGEVPVAVALALAAYLMPGALLALAVGSRVQQFDPRLLVAMDAVCRLAGLGIIAGLARADHLGLALYVALLAASSLFHSFGSGGIVSLVGSHVPGEHRFAANSLVEAVTNLSITVVGPAIGGVLVAVLGAPTVLIIDAASFLFLLLGAVTMPRPQLVDTVAAEGVPRRALRVLLSSPTVAWLLALTVVFYGLYGPVETALPVLVRHDLASGPQLLGTVWAAFGVGALAGGLAAGTRSITNLRRFTLAIVAGWGLALLLVAATLVPVVVVLGFAAGGIIYAPYPAAATSLLQHELHGRELTTGAVAWNSVAAVVVPLGTLVGGPMIADIGARGTLGLSAVATIGLAVIVSLLFRHPPERTT